jgi:hypothetical protein
MDGSKVEWSIEESEKRLSAFADKVSKRWLNDKTCSLPRRKGRDDPKETTKKFKCRRSAEALQIFIKLNFLVLDIRKVSFTSIFGLFDTDLFLRGISSEYRGDSEAC